MSRTTACNVRGLACSDEMRVEYRTITNSAALHSICFYFLPIWIYGTFMVHLWTNKVNNWFMKKVDHLLA